eukprot:15442728-Alexandrium_andersonii.AAC.1
MAIVLQQIKPVVTSILGNPVLRGTGKRFFFLARDVREDDKYLSRDGGTNHDLELGRLHEFAPLSRLHQGSGRWAIE